MSVGRPRVAVEGLKDLLPQFTDRAFCWAPESGWLREEVRPIKSEIAIYDFVTYDFAKYVCSQCKTHQNQTYTVLSKIALYYSY
jgi:hypothetical protein